jgi:hypothetical protein
MINRCALGLIADRGATVIDPALNELSTPEQDFLSRHVDGLRSRQSDDGTVYCTFSPTSTTEADLSSCLQTSDSDFVAIAKKMANALAATTQASPKAATTCVVALLTSTEGDSSEPTVATFLKLDARIEAARLKRVQASSGGIRLEVFKDLLPAPGDLQKGFSWPDPRHPASSLIFHDTNQGDAALYFPNAFSLRVSSKAAETEKVMVAELVKQYGPKRAGEVVATIDSEGGRADAVIARIPDSYGAFDPASRALGGGGALPGVI